MATGVIHKPLDNQAAAGQAAWNKVGNINFGQLTYVWNLQKLELVWNSQYNRIELRCTAADGTVFHVVSAY